MRTVRTLSLGLLAAGAAAAVGAAGAAAATDPTPTPSGGALSSSEVATLSVNRDEERVARDLYAYFADRYGTAPFARIAASEQRHFDAVGTLLDRYGVKDPAAGATVGTYADPTLQELYDRWKAQGSASADAAYQVGVALEKRDIADLQKGQEATDNADLDRLYGHLEQASVHHLAAFTAAAEGTLPAGQGTGMPGRHGDRTGNGPRDGSGTGTGPGMGSGARDGSGMGNGAGRHAGSGDCPNG